jgi:hypothetical protein
MICALRRYQYLGLIAMRNSKCTATKLSLVNELTAIRKFFRWNFIIRHIRISE